MSLRPRLTGDQKEMITKECFGCGNVTAHQHLHDCAPTELPKHTWSARNDSFASCAGMSHGLAAMALSGFLSRLTKCAESQDLRLEPLDVRKATLSTVLARASAGIALKEALRDRAVQVTTSDCRVGRHLTA